MLPGNWWQAALASVVASACLPLLPQLVLVVGAVVAAAPFAICIITVVGL